MSGLTSVSEGAALSHPRPELLALTGLRGVVAVGVVASSVGVWRTAPAVLHDLVAAGVLAVPFFVLLSGFVLAYNYPGLGFSSGRRALGRYTMARLARILPLLLVVGLGVVLLGALNGGDWVRAVFADQGWFVAVLVLMYVCFPLLAPAIAARRTAAAGAAVVAGGLMMAADLLTSAVLYRWPVVWLPVFVLGMALPGVRLPVGVGTAFRWLAHPILVRLGVIGYPLFLIHPLVLHGFGPVRAGTPAYALLALCWIALAVLVAEGAHRYVAVPGRRWLMELARRAGRGTASVEG